MKKLLAIGEALIDFTPEKTGMPLCDVPGFMPNVGGAPANVSAAYALLGGHSVMITQVGEDPFGDKIENKLKDVGVDVSCILRSHEAKTSLAFVALKEDGERDFSFFRNPGADMLFKSSQLKEEWFKDCFALHFCSVSLGDFPMKEAHRTAIEYARKSGALINFDPNLRFNLWDDAEALKKTVNEFLPLADIVKISDEEVCFITGEKDPYEGIKKLFVGNVKLVIYTKGGKGAEAHTLNAKATVPGNGIPALDSTGAGDAFIGSFLFMLSKKGKDVNNIADMTSEELEECLAFSNKYCKWSIQRYGAIESYATYDEIIKYASEDRQKEV